MRSYGYAKFSAPPGFSVIRALDPPGMIEPRRDPVGGAAASGRNDAGAGGPGNGAAAWTRLAFARLIGRTGRDQVAGGEAPKVSRQLDGIIERLGGIGKSGANQTNGTGYEFQIPVEPGKERQFFRLRRF